MNLAYGMKFWHRFCASQKLILLLLLLSAGFGIEIDMNYSKLAKDSLFFIDKTEKHLSQSVL